MSDEAALLTAIVAHPEEDTPRLMYADWLDENGQPERAEFIRLQIERSQLGREDPRWRALISREAELLVAGKRTWVRPYLLWTDLHQMTVRRGIVELAGATAAALAPHVDSFRELTALLELHVQGYHYTAIPTEEEPPAAPPPRRGWFGTALRKVAALVQPGAAPPHIGYLCRINLAARPPGLRIRVPLGTKGSVGHFGELLALDLLDPNATDPDPQLRTGTWTVLAWSPGVPDEWRLVGRLARALCLHTQHAPAEFFRQRVAARPVRSPEEVAAWSGLHVPGAGPHWLRVRNGVAIEWATGSGPPADWLGGLSLEPPRG